MPVASFCYHVYLLLLSSHSHTHIDTVVHSDCTYKDTMLKAIKFSTVIPLHMSVSLAIDGKDGAEVICTRRSHVTPAQKQDDDENDEASDKKRWGICW